MGIPSWLQTKAVLVRIAAYAPGWHNGIDGEGATYHGEALANRGFSPPACEGLDVRDYDRTILLERLEREGATVGAQIPTSIEIDQERIALRTEVLALTVVDTPTEEDRQRARALQRSVRQARRQRYDRLKAGECSREEGEVLVEEIRGLDRALNAIADLGETSVEEEAKRRERMNDERWMQFLRQALGHDSNRRT